MPDSIHYDKALTDALRLHNQELNLDASKDTESHQYEEPNKGMEIIEVLDDTAEGERRVLGHCTFKIYEKPVKFLYVSWVVRKNKPGTSDGKIDGKTVGDIVMDKANTYIQAKGLPGILGNTVPKDTNAHDVYERNGWKKLPIEDPNTVWMGYNLEKDFTSEQLDGIVSELKADDPYFQNHGG